MDKYINFTCDEKNISLSFEIASMIPVIAGLEPCKNYFLDRDYYLVNAFFSAVRFDNYNKLNNKEYEEARIWLEEPERIMGSWNANIIEITVAGQSVRTSIETLKRCNYYKQIFENFNGKPMPLDMSVDAFKEIIRYLRNPKCRINKKYKDETIFLQIDYKTSFKQTEDKEIEITPIMNKPLVKESKKVSEYTNKYLNENPDITFNKMVYSRHVLTQKESKILNTTNINGDSYLFCEPLDNHGIDNLFRGLFCKMEGMNYKDLYESIERIKISIDDILFVNLSGDGLNLENRIFKDNHEKSGGLTYLWVLNSGIAIPLLALQESPKILKVDIKFKTNFKRKFILGCIHHIVYSEEKDRLQHLSHEYLHKPLIDTSIQVTKGEKTIIEFNPYDGLLDTERLINEDDLNQTSFESFFYIMNPQEGIPDINGSLKVSILDTYTGKQIPIGASPFTPNFNQLKKDVNRDIRKYIKDQYEKHKKNKLTYELYAINRLQSKEFIELEYDYNLSSNIYASIFSLIRSEIQQPSGFVNGFSYCFEIIPEFTGELILCSRTFRVLRIMNGKAEWVNKFEGWYRTACDNDYSLPIACINEEKELDDSKR